MMCQFRLPSLVLPILACRVVLGQAPIPPPRAAEFLESADGRPRAGRLLGDPKTGFRFAPGDGSAPVALAPGIRIAFESPPAPASAAPPPPFRVLFGGGQRLSGRLLKLSAEAIRLDPGTGAPPTVVSRGGALALIQRPGEATVLLEPFSSIDPAHWSVTGDPESVDAPGSPGGRSLRLSATGASVTTRLPEPVAAGRLEIAYFDPGGRAAGRRQFVDLTFRAASGELSTVRAVLGWAEETLGVESPTGPTLAVQPLARTAGWHRLAVRFAADSLELTVDRLELAHGDSAPGPLAEVRLATEVVEGSEPAGDLSARFDDLQITRLASPSGRLEVEPAQDEARLVTGDQVFGVISEADDRRIALKVDDRSTSLPWSEVSGLYFRRIPALGAYVAGLLVRLDWRASASADGRDVDSIDGALLSANDSEVTVQTAFAGILAIPRDRLIRLEVNGRGTRFVIDPKSHHLGDRMVVDLDPPQPEGDSLAIPFDLTGYPQLSARLSIDVVQVVSAQGNSEQRVAAGELLTHVILNDRELDTLNRHVSARNESPERIGIEIPPGLLKVGRNVLRFRQDGMKDDPSKRDNLGLLGIAIEVPPPKMNLPFNGRLPDGSP